MRFMIFSRMATSMVRVPRNFHVFDQIKVATLLATAPAKVIKLKLLNWTHEAQAKVIKLKLIS